MKKILVKLHLWLAIPFGIIITILCLTGALLVFETEIQQITNPKRFYVNEVKENPIPLNELIPMVQKQLPDSVSVSSVTFPAQPNRTYRMGMSGMGRTSVVVNPYTGEVVDTVTPYAKGEFFSAVRRLHRWFLYPMQRDKINWGKMLTGTTTLIFVFILITGIIIWLPKTITTLKRRTRIKTGAGRFRFWYDMHLVGGIYMAIILLTMSLTGLTWSFDWYRTGFYKLFGVEITQGHSQPQPKPNQVQASSGKPSGERGERGGRAKKNPDYVIWTNIYHQLAESNPGYKTISLQNGSATVSTTKAGNTRASDKYVFDSRTGEITEIQLYKDNPKSSKMRGWIYSIHVGSWGGIFTRILYLVACLVGVTLPLSGYYIYIRKHRKKKA